MWDGTVSGRRRFCPRFVGVVDVSEYFSSGDVAVSSPGACSVFMNLSPNQRSVSRVGVSTPCGTISFCEIVVVVEIPFVGIVGV